MNKTRYNDVLSVAGLNPHGTAMRHHLAILYRTYVTQIIQGRKTVECRLGEMGYPPHGQVRVGDLVWLKEVSGPVRAVVRVSGVRSLRLEGARSLDRVRREWNDRILAPASFWRSRQGASMATLIELGDLCAFRPFRIVKTDRRAWVSLSHPPVPGRPLRTARNGPDRESGATGGLAARQDSGGPVAGGTGRSKAQREGQTTDHTRGRGRPQQARHGKQARRGRMRGQTPAQA